MDPRKKLERFLKNRIRAIGELKQVAQKLKWALIPNAKSYSDDPTVGYVIGDPNWVYYIKELMEEDLKKAANEELAQPVEDKEPA